MNIKQQLKQKKIKISTHKVSIYDYLLKHRNHPDADKIYEDLSKELPSLAKATVYNVLKEFLEKQIVIGIPIENKMHYDAYLDHVHFLCTECHTLYDLSIPLEKIETKEIDGHLVSMKCELYKGICKNCKEKRSE